MYSSYDAFSYNHQRIYVNANLRYEFLDHRMKPFAPLCYRRHLVQLVFNRLLDDLHDVDGIGAPVKSLRCQRVKIEALPDGHQAPCRMRVDQNGARRHCDIVEVIVLIDNLVEVHHDTRHFVKRHFGTLLKRRRQRRVQLLAKRPQLSQRN